MDIVMRWKSSTKDLKAFPSLTTSTERLVQASFSNHIHVLRILAIVLFPVLCGPISMQKRLYSIDTVSVIGPTSVIVSFLIILYVL